MRQGMKAGNINLLRNEQSISHSLGVRRTLGVLNLLGLTLLTLNAWADTVNTESLGVVNGSMTTRSQMVEVTPFLSGRPLYQYDVQDTQPPVSTLLIEQAQPISGASRRDGLVWMQQPLALTGSSAQGGKGVFQLPLQVEIAGKAVDVTVREDSRGLVLTLPQPSRQVRVRPAGAINFMLPVTYRGDIRADIRIMGNTATTETLSE